MNQVPSLQPLRTKVGGPPPVEGTWREGRDLEGDVAHGVLVGFPSPVPVSRSLLAASN